MHNHMRVRGHALMCMPTSSHTCTSAYKNMHTHRYTCPQAHTQAWVHICMHVHIQAHMHTRLHMRSHTQTLICMLASSHTSIAHKYMHADMHTRPPTSTHARANTHTRTQSTSEGRLQAMLVIIFKSCAQVVLEPGCRFMYRTKFPQSPDQRLRGFVLGPPCRSHTASHQRLSINHPAVTRMGWGHLLHRPSYSWQARRNHGGCNVRKAGSRMCNMPLSKGWRCVPHLVQVLRTRE